MVISTVLKVLLHFRPTCVLYNPCRSWSVIIMPPFHQGLFFFTIGPFSFNCVSLQYPVSEKCPFLKKNYIGLYFFGIVLIFKFMIHCNSYWFWLNIEPYLAIVLRNYRFFVTLFARSSAESCRGYTKAPEGRRELQRVHESSRGQARQGDLQKTLGRPRRPAADGFWSATVFENV